MSRLLAQVAIPYTSGVPEDVSVNTWAFDTGAGGVSVPSISAIISGLVGFYDEVDEIYSEIIGSDYQIKLYDIDEPEPRTPLSVVETAWPDAGSNPLPEEVACCLSFRGLYASGSPPARRRGRVYIGPLGTTAAGELSGRSAPAAIVETVLAAGVANLTTALGAGGVELRLVQG